MIIKEQEEKIVYSDGETVEKEMLEIAKKYPEDLSEEYISDCSKYTVNNTFSSVRKNILNWYPFKADADILEVGAGMGSITGFLCDIAKSVTSIEMSEARANVIKARYPGKNNLEIIDQDINEWKTDKKFDYVVFIGVLEYAAIFSDVENPFEFFMTNIKNLLKPDGTVLFAIENKFGLKYWAGAAEDHLQKPFVGIEGYKEKKTAQTFSKAELESLLDSVGLMNKRFYYVLPDYKFPTMICTDEYEPNYSELKKISFTYSKNSSLLFDEKDVYKDIIQNHKIDFFANSYLVEAKINELDSYHIIHVSARGESKQEYRVSTLIDNLGNVKKVPMHKKAVKHIHNIEANEKALRQKGISLIETVSVENTIQSKFINLRGAQSYFEEFLKTNNRNELDLLIQKLRHGLELSSLKSESKTNIFDEANLNLLIRSPEEIILKDGYIDMTFYNAFYKDGELIFYDQEWRFDNVPLNFILYYAIKSAYNRLQVKTEISLKEILKKEGLYENREAYDKLEDYIWSKVLYRQTDFYGEDGYCNRFSEENSLSKKINCLEEKKTENEEKIRTLDIELNNKIGHVEQLIISERNLKGEVERKEGHIIQLNHSLEKKEERIIYLTQKEAILNQELNNKNGHIEYLLISERKLMAEISAIKSSRLYRIISMIWRLEDVIFPHGSKRRFFMGVLLRAIRHPIRTIRKLSVSKWKNMFRYMSGKQNLPQLPVEEVVENTVVFNHIEEIKSLDDCDEILFPIQENPTVSIIIPVYNQFTYTYQCLRSIWRNSSDISYEIIIADDCSDDLTKNLADKVKNIKIIKPDTNLRFLKNCNHAAKHAKGKYILFLNNDTQVQEKWLVTLVDLCESDKSIGMVGSKLIYADGRLQEAGGILWEDGSAWNYGNGQDASLPEYNYVKDVDYISGASIMIRAELWNEIGEFDERFAPAYCEDSDLAFSVRKAGYRVVYQPKSVVIHYEGISNGKDVNSGIKKYQADNCRKLYDKWTDEFKKQYPNGNNLFRAREHSKDKKVLVMIDHYVPHYDQDAGSKTIFQYLQMFIKQGFIVKFIGDNFYQHEPYTTTLQQMGIEVLYGNYYANHIFEWLKSNKDNIDYVFLNRPHISIKYIDFFVRETDIKIIYYGHDLHFLRCRREYELTGETKKLEEAEEWKEKELYLMRKADITYYPSCIEEEEIHAIDASIPVKAITAYVFEHFKETIEYDFSKRKGILFVGGFGHTPNLDAVLWFTEEILPEIRKELDIPFYIVGSRAPESVTELDGKNGIVVKGFVSNEELDEIYQNCRMVVVPLRYGAGVKGKVIEAIYNGLPIVTTSIGAEGINEAEDILLIEDDAHRFADLVVSMYQDKEKLEEISRGTQSFIKKYFSTEAVWDIIKEDFV